MSKTNFTYVAILIDRSGSMNTIKDDIMGGLKTFASEQRKVDGEIKVSLFDFDIKFQTIGENENLDLLERYVLVPRGNTALHDAIGRSVARVGEILAGMQEDERPEKVIFMIVTDGQENASTEYNSLQVSDIIKHQKEKYNWDFLYLGANQDAVEVANSIGISKKKSITYKAGGQGVNSVFRSFTGYVSASRADAVMDMAFSEEDRKNAVK